MLGNYTVFISKCSKDTAARECTSMIKIACLSAFQKLSSWPVYYQISSRFKRSAGWRMLQSSEEHLNLPWESNNECTMLQLTGLKNMINNIYVVYIYNIVYMLYSLGQALDNLSLWTLPATCPEYLENIPAPSIKMLQSLFYFAPGCLQLFTNLQILPSSDIKCQKRDIWRTLSATGLKRALWVDQTILECLYFKQRTVDTGL